MVSILTCYCHTWHNLSLFIISPGRFFAANEAKALLAHLIVTYDMKFEEGKGAPRDLQIGMMRIPRGSDVMFRTRRK
jgi:hypothetical protein